MITIRVIYNHWTQQTQNGNNNIFFIIARLKAEDESPLGESNPQPCAPQVRFGAALAPSNSPGLLLLAFWHPGIVQVVGSLRDPETFVWPGSNQTNNLS